MKRATAWRLAGVLPGCKVLDPPGFSWQPPPCLAAVAAAGVDCCCSENCSDGLGFASRSAAGCCSAADCSAAVASSAAGSVAAVIVARSRFLAENCCCLESAGPDPSVSSCCGLGSRGLSMHCASCRS